MVENTQPQKKVQTMRFDDAELAILKNTFAERDDLLKAIRKIFLQLELTEQEDIIARVLTDDKVNAVVKKIFMPVIVGDEPLHEILDLYMTTEIKDRDIDTAYFNIQIREKMIQYLKEIFDKIDGDANLNSIEFKTLKDITEDKEQTVFNYNLRNFILSHVEQRLAQIKALAGQKEETPEEQEKRLTQNSNK